MKIRYKIIVSIFSFTLLFYLLVLYVNHTLIPVKLKGLFAKSISEYTQRGVDIETLRFSIAKGFILDGLKIYEGPKENNKFLFKASRASFGIIFLPSLKKHRLIIPRISIDQPYLHLERLQKGNWNISSILTKKTKSEKVSPFRIAVKGFSFKQGELTFSDYYKGKDFQRTITSLKGGVGLALPNFVSFSLSGNIDDNPIKISLRFKPTKKELSIELETENLKLADYWSEYLTTLASSRLTAEGYVHSLDKLKIYSGICSTSLRIDISNLEKIKTKGNIYIENLKADFNDITITGNYKLTGRAGFNIKDFTNLSYALRLELDEANISTPLKPLKDVGKIKGLLSLSEKRWAVKGLSCILYGSPTVISGTLDSPHKDFIANIDLSSTLTLKDIADTVNIDFKNGKAQINTKITYKKDRSCYVSGTSKIEGLKLHQKDIIISGDFFINGETQGTVGDWESLRYKGNVRFNHASIEGMGPLPLISDASGETTFSTNHIIIKRLIGTATGTKINLSGSIDYLKKESKIDLTLKANKLSLSKFISTLPEEIRIKFKDIGADGICSADVNFTGTAGRPETFSYSGKLLLKNGSLILPYWPNEITDIGCNILFEKQKITWEDLYFNIKDIQYNSYGRLTDFTQPKISLSLKFEDANAIAEIKIDKDKIINILKCSGGYRGSTFLIAGRISDMRTTFAEVSGNIYLDLKDTPYIFKTQADRLDKLKPKGNLKLTFNMRGPLREVADWTLSAEGTSGSIYLGDLEFKDFYLDYRMKDHFIDIPLMAAYPYGGIINISSRTNLKTEEQPYLINIDVKDVDLHQLVKDTEYKDKRIKGLFAARSVLNGYLSKKESLYGNGWLQVSDGYLWEFPVMRGIMEVIFMMPPEYVTLTDAFGNFSVHDNRIYTEDFKMLSKTASLLWMGSLGFDTTLDFDITGRFAEDVIKKTSERGRIASAVLREAGNLIMEIKLTGTLANPRYQIVTFPVKRIIKEKVIDKFKDIFGL